MVIFAFVQSTSVHLRTRCSHGNRSPLKLSAEQYYREIEEQRNAHSSQQQPDSFNPKGDEHNEASADTSGEVQGDQANAAPAEQGTSESAAPDTSGESSGGRKDVPTPCRLDTGTSGSCADGQVKPWEDPPPSKEGDGPPAIANHEQDQLIRRVAEAIEKSPGSGRGVWSSLVQQILHPKIDPRVLLTMAIRKAVEQTSGGHDDTSYRRLSRRLSVGGVIRPSRVALIPRILLIIDRSGSMNQTDLGLELGLVNKVLSGLRLRDAVRVIVGDTCAQSTQNVFDAKKVEIVGRGGTDVGAIMQQAYDDAVIKPQLIVAVTDGETPWPSNRLPIPVVACLTRDERQRRVPSWIKCVGLVNRKFMLALCQYVTSDDVSDAHKRVAESEIIRDGRRVTKYRALPGCRSHLFRRPRDPGEHSAVWRAIPVRRHGP